MRSTAVRLCLLGLLAVSLAGCDRAARKTKAGKTARAAAHKQLALWPAQPVSDLPLEARQRNKGGSCMHASMATSLNSVQQYQLADQWWSAHRGGASFDYLRSEADRSGMRYAFTGDGDVAFLEWVIRTRRTCVVSDLPDHARTLVGLDPAWKAGSKAYVQDNNGKAEKLAVYDRETWIARWRRQGGDAMCPLYDPLPVITHN